MRISIDLRDPRPLSSASTPVRQDKSRGSARTPKVLAGFLLLATLGSSLMAGTITVDVSAVVSANFTDTYGYFGGGTIDAGAAVSMDYTYDPSQCSYEVSSNGEQLSACTAGSMNASVTLNGVTLNDSNDVPAFDYQDTISNAVGGLSYRVWGGTNLLDLYVTSDNGYQPGVISAGAPANLNSDSSIQVCTGGTVGGNCEYLYSDQTTLSSTPEPRSSVLLGSGFLFLLAFQLFLRNGAVRGEMSPIPSDPDI